MNYTGKKVVVGLTGRVASGVSAFLLKKQGFKVIGVSIVTNGADSFPAEALIPKCHMQNLDGIQNFCDHLGIPFYATDGRSEFEAKVMDPFVSDKLTAKANSTCFNCTRLRMDILFNKMKLLKADFISTGHFCKVHKNLNAENYAIHANNDVHSDQSFLLAGLDEEILKHLILPLGELRVKEVNTIAQKFNLPLEDSFEDKSFCFQQKETYGEQLEKRIPKTLLKEGQVINKSSDAVHGDHAGIVNHFITETNLGFSGLAPNDSKTQIIDYNFNSGSIFIGTEEDLTFRGCQLVDLAFNSGLDRTRPMGCFIKSKFSNEYVAASLFFKNNRSVYIQFKEPIYPLIEGENLILFDRNTRNAKVIGRGIVSARGEFKLVDRAREFKSVNEANLEKTKPKIFKF